MIFPHHIQRIQMRDGLKGVESDQRAAGMCVKHLCTVPGLQTFKDCKKTAKITCAETNAIEK